MARFILCAIILFLAAFSASLAINAAEEKTDFDKDLEIINDEPIQNDEKLSYAILKEELENGKNLQYGQTLTHVTFNIYLFCSYLCCFLTDSS